MDYKDRYTLEFKDNLESLAINNIKLKSIIKKAIDIILENPYIKSEFIEQLGCRRKHAGGDKYRIFYNIEKGEIHFYALRLKNKRVYKEKIKFDIL